MYFVCIGEFYYANMTAGDCLYIPYKWIHQVRSHDRNIAVNLWWDHPGTKALNLERCKVILKVALLIFAKDSMAIQTWLGLRITRLDCSIRSSTQDANVSHPITFRDVDWGHFIEDESFKAHIISMAEDADVSIDRMRSVYFEDNFSGKSIFDGNCYGSLLDDVF